MTHAYIEETKALKRRKRTAKPIAKRIAKPRRRKAKRRPKKGKQAPTVGVRLRTLVGILMFLYMLRLIDDKTFRRLAGGLYPKKKAKRRRRRKK